MKGTEPFQGLITSLTHCMTLSLYLSERVTCTSVRESYQISPPHCPPLNDLLTLFDLFLAIAVCHHPPPPPSHHPLCSLHILLNQRVEYLSRAVMCAKSTAMTTSLSHDGELLHELEEKMEVRRVGSKITWTVTLSLHCSHKSHWLGGCLSATFCNHCINTQYASHSNSPSNAHMCIHI